MERDRGIRTSPHALVGASPLEDYWQEFSSFEESTHPDEDEDEATKTPDEGEAEEEWLREAGFENLVDSAELSDERGFDEILTTLTARQRAVVQKKLQTFQMSKKKKKQKNKQRADVRQVFTCFSPPETVATAESDQAKYEPSELACSAGAAAPTLNDRPVVFKGSPAAAQEEPQKTARTSTSSVLPPFLRTGHSGGFTLREHHSKGIDTESPTSVEVLRYETRKSLQEREPLSFNDETKNRPSPEAPEISFQRFVSKLDPADDVTGRYEYSDMSWDDHIPVADLNEEDRTLVRSLAVIEVAALLDSHGLIPSRSRKRKRKKGKENVVFGAPLTTLLDLDRRRCTGLKLPLIYQWILHHLHENGLQEEGLMRLAGSVQKVEALKAECERNYLASPLQVEGSIGQSSVHDVAILLKQLVRHLPEPLLTNCHMDTFLQVPNIPSAQDQVTALNLLVLALPDVHRELLQELLYFLEKVVQHESQNRMSLSNVAMIMAPNLFPPPRVKKSHHKSNDLAAEVTVAALSSRVTQLLIKTGYLLGMVPKELLAQARLQSRHSSKKQAKRSGGRKTKSEKSKADKEAIFPSSYRPSVIRVHVASVRNTSSCVPVAVDERTTAGQVVEKVARVLDRFTDTRGADNYGQHEHKVLLMQRPRTTSEPVPMRQKCHLGSKKPNESLKDHFLYHIGENAGERMLEHSAGVLGVTNGTSSVHSAGSSWEVRCHH